LMSQIDIAPTLLGLLDFRYYTKFLGRDVLHSDPSSDRAFVGNFQTLAYLKGGRMAVLQPKQRVDVLDFDGRQPSSAEQDSRLEREAISFYEVASYVFRNGLYLDEEQVLPEQRVAAAPARIH